MQRQVSNTTVRIYTGFFNSIMFFLASLCNLSNDLPSLRDVPLKRLVRMRLWLWFMRKMCLMIASKCKCIFTVLFSYKTPITFFFFFYCHLGSVENKLLTAHWSQHCLTSTVLCHHSRKAWLHQLSRKKKTNSPSTWLIVWDYVCWCLGQKQDIHALCSFGKEKNISR